MISSSADRVQAMSAGLTKPWPCDSSTPAAAASIPAMTKAVS